MPNGDGLVMQVTTPCWPASGSKSHPRTDGNTLGCVDDDNVKVSQHFFAVKLTKSDLILVLRALQNASVVTNPRDPQIANIGGPSDVVQLIAKLNLGTKSSSQAYRKDKLSSDIELISKPSQLNVPPWQMVSALLGGVPLRAATWWANPKIYTTTNSTDIACWADGLGDPGAQAIEEQRSSRLGIGPYCGLLLVATTGIAVAIATDGKVQVQSEPKDLCQVPDAPTMQHSEAWGDCYIGSNPNPEGTLCIYMPTFFSPRFKLIKSGEYVRPGEQNSRLFCERTDDTLTFFKWVLTDQKIR